MNLSEGEKHRGSVVLPALTAGALGLIINRYFELALDAHGVTE